MRKAASFLLTRYKGKRDGSVSLTSVSFLFCVALYAPVSLCISGIWQVMRNCKCLGIVKCLFEFMIENSKGGPELKAELVLPGKWCHVFFKESMWEKFLKASAGLVCSY